MPAPIVFESMQAIRKSTIAIVLPAAMSAAVVLIALSSSTTGDYLGAGPVGGDNPGPAINALIGGHLAAFLARQPFMGLVSLLLRVPFAALASLLGGGNRLLYAAGAVACVMPAMLLALYLLRTRLADGGRVAALSGAAILMLSPLTLDAIQAGHPEELLASVLATAAVLAARSERGGWAGVLLGLSVGTKPWTVIAALPALAALSDQRLKTATIAAGLALLLTMAAPLANMSAFDRAQAAVGDARTANTLSLWWPLSSPIATIAAGAPATTARRLPGAITRSDALLLVLAVVIGASALGARALRRNGRSVDALALLALLAVVRCVGDPWDLNYYFVAAVVPLVAWEILSVKRAPIVSMLATTASVVTFGVGLRWPPALLAGVVLAWSLTLCLYLAQCAFPLRRVQTTPAWAH